MGPVELRVGSTTPPGSSDCGNVLKDRSMDEIRSADVCRH